MEAFTVTAADGRALETVVAGAVEGPLVVLHHGTPGSAHAIYPPHAEKAATRGIRLALYGRPGYAGSERAEERTVGDCAADTAAVADALGAEDFFTIGGSGGGPHALACAALLADRVSAAVALASPAPMQ